MKISPFIFPLFSLRTVSVWSKNNPPEDNDGCDPCGLRDAENTFENFAFQTEVPNALSPGFKYVPDSGNRFTVDIGMATNHEPGFTFTSSTGNNIPAQSTIYGYGVDGEYTWPGKTFEVNRGVRYEVTWRNKIYPGPYILTGKGDYCEDSVVDTSLHWAYSVTAGSFEVDGVPIVTHLHGGHTDSLNDGNPEFYYNYDETVVGPQYVTSTYTYEDNIDATSLWYHDHALGITRLNVYAGLAGFYFVRDPSSDSGKWPNRLNLPVYPYEVALAIQDRMFKNDGSLFYPAFPGDPAYDDFIDCDSMEEVCEDEFGPTALAEFFGDHMVVNGKVWPKTDVEPRNYRLRLLVSPRQEPNPMTQSCLFLFSCIVCVFY
jgi:FtsP/CotA-like multicopper oxidase with cupredoxin domain